MSLRLSLFFLFREVFFCLGSLEFPEHRTSHGTISCIPSNDPNRHKNPEWLALHELEQHVDPILENQKASQCEKEKPCIPSLI